MEIRRGPQSSDYLTTTDTKSPSEYPSWRPGMAIRFDGTIDKEVDRRTDIGVVIDEEDVIALHKGLLDHYRGCVKERDKLLRTVGELESALAKISDLVSSEKNRAPDQNYLLSACVPGMTQSERGESPRAR